MAQLPTAQGKVRQQSICGEWSHLTAQRASCTVLLDAQRNADGAHGVSASAKNLRDVTAGVEEIMANRALFRQGSSTRVHNHGVVE